MIGNDIVDLYFVDSPAYRHVEYLQRVCNAAELRAVRGSESPSKTLAALWASKEAVYKLLMQEGVECKFVPRQFGCDFSNREETPRGYLLAVQFRNLRRKVNVAMAENWVHAVAASSERSAVDWAVGEVDRTGFGSVQVLNESFAVRRLASDFLSKRGLRDMTLEVKERIPRLVRRNGERAGIGISLSHHGRFSAVAIADVPTANLQPWSAYLSRQHDGEFYS